MRQYSCLVNHRPCSTSFASVNLSHHYCWTNPSKGLEVFTSELAGCLQLDAAVLPWGCSFWYQGVVTYNPQCTAFGTQELGSSGTFPQNFWLLLVHCWEMETSIFITIYTYSLQYFLLMSSSEPLQRSPIRERFPNSISKESRMHVIVDYAARALYRLDTKANVHSWRYHVNYKSL